MNGPGVSMKILLTRCEYEDFERTPREYEDFEWTSSRMSCAIMIACGECVSERAGAPGAPACVPVCPVSERQLRECALV